MKRFRVVLTWYDQILLLFLFVMGVASGQFTQNLGVLLLLLPVLFYFSGTILNSFLHLDRRRLRHVMFISALVYAYSAVMTLLLFLSSLSLIRSLPELIFSLAFLPLPGHFFLNAYVAYRKWKLRFQKLRAGKIKPEPVVATLEEENDNTDIKVLSEVEDVKRRQFIKLLGGGSLGMIIMLFLSPQKAGAAFFGSVPGPGTVALKDSTGTVIDPKEKSPTDGYTISQLDDSGSTNYYGFVNKIGEWYISRESNDGSYRYTKGTSSFSTNWTNRASLTYDYFDNIF